MALDVRMLIVALAGLMLVAGAGIWAPGLLQLRKWWTMRRLEPADPGNVEEGLREFEGRAVAAEGTVTAPLSGTECLVCNHEIERYSPGSGTTGSNSGGWKTLDEGTRTAPFEVEGSGSTVAVDPEDAQHLLTEEYRLEPDGSEELPDRVREYMDEHVWSDTGKLIRDTLEEQFPDSWSEEPRNSNSGGTDFGSSGTRYRIVEERLDEGEEVYVVGDVTRDQSAVPQGSSARVAVNPDSHGRLDALLGSPFVVGDTDEQAAVRRQRNSALKRVALGLLFAASPLAIVFLMAWLN